MYVNICGLQVYPSKSVGMAPAGIMMHTGQVTERIKELVALIRDPSKSAFVPCAEKISEAVNDLTSTISQVSNKISSCGWLHFLTHFILVGFSRSPAKSLFFIN